MNSTKLVSGRLLARNTLLNFIGQAVPLLVGNRREAMKKRLIKKISEKKLCGFI